MASPDSSNGSVTEDKHIGKLRISCPFVFVRDTFIASVPTSDAQ